MVTFNEAKAVSQVIVKDFHPISVIVFGSVAKEGSGLDLDLLIITGDEWKFPEHPDLLVYRSLKQFYRRFSIDPFIITKSTFKEYWTKGSPFLRLIMKEGRILYMKDAVREWISLAEEELHTAMYLLDGGFFKGTCYHSQQAVEKAIKAVLISKGWDIEKTHSIERLIAIAEDYAIQIDISDEDIVFMDSIYRSRYPAEAGLLPLREPSETDARRSVDIAREVVATMGRIVVDKGHM